MSARARNWKSFNPLCGECGDKIDDGAPRVHNFTIFIYGGNTTRKSKVYHLRCYRRIPGNET